MTTTGKSPTSNVSGSPKITPSKVASVKNRQRDFSQRARDTVHQATARHDRDS